MKGFLTFAGLCLLVIVLVSGWAVSEAFLKSSPAGAAPVSIEVAEGETVADIADDLADHDLIASERVFRLFVRLSGTGGAFRAGTFELTPGMSYASIVAVMTIATSAKEIELTIPEGYTRAQIGEAVHAAFPSITSAHWEAATGAASPFKTDATFADLFTTVPKAATLEGYLFPDTYRFLVDATADDIVHKMLVTFRKRLADAKITPSHDLIILASIVEREVRGAEDMRLVADIFLKRLEMGMALQADSTVNYATGGKNPSASYADIEIDSPYNTYKHAGLPPGPISNPGMNAISAAATPSPNPFYYFLTTPEGEVKYARTFEEHVENRRLFLR